jgi:hypothetical protein
MECRTEPLHFESNDAVFRRMALFASIQVMADNDEPLCDIAALAAIGEAIAGDQLAAWKESAEGSKEEDPCSHKPQH